MKTYYPSNSQCIDCNSHLSAQVYQYSMSNFKLALCMDCQDVFRERSNKSTPDALKLYIALRERNVPAELEKWDGHKTIDIAVTHAKVNIEVDGAQHNYSAKQALSDLQRTFYAFKKGYLTLRIPNSLVKNDLEQTANFITKFLCESREQLTYS